VGVSRLETTRNVPKTATTIVACVVAAARTTPSEAAKRLLLVCFAAKRKEPADDYRCCFRLWWLRLEVLAGFLRERHHHRHFQHHYRVSSFGSEGLRGRGNREQCQRSTRPQWRFSTAEEGSRWRRRRWTSGGKGLQTKPAFRTSPPRVCATTTTTRQLLLLLLRTKTTNPLSLVLQPRRHQNHLDRSRRLQIA